MKVVLTGRPQPYSNLLSLRYRHPSCRSSPFLVRFQLPAKCKSPPRLKHQHPPTPLINFIQNPDPHRGYAARGKRSLKWQTPLSWEDNRPQSLIVGGVSFAIVIILIMGMDEQKALAWGPEGPLVEEFWDNVRRYALYALTVSTGALYTILQPIVELLKNPISAILVLLILGATVYIVSQVLSAMVGVTDFSYDYAY